MKADQAEVLLERQGETDALARALAAAADGSGRALSIEGSAGIGKTALLHEALRRAFAAGFTVLRGTASELETAYPFGVVQQLFAGLDDGERAAALEGTSDAAAAVMRVGAPQGVPGVDQLPAAVHGLFWMTANLARRGPLLIGIDDAQWADDASTRWMDFLARRLDGLPIVMIATVRSGEPGTRRTPADREFIRPAPLSADGSHALMERRLGAAVGDAFAEASHRATGGNPLLVEQLAAAVAANGWRPDDDQAAQLAGFGPSETEAFALRRLDTLGASAAAVARAVAVLGSSPSLDVVAALAGIDAPECARAADLLVDAGLLASDQPLTFLHPVLEAAVRNSIPPHQQSLMHRQAAQLLLDRDAGPARVAPHLLHTDPGDDPAVVEMLRAAAADAVANGALDFAVRALARAYEEPPPRQVAAQVALELGRCQLATGDAGAIPTLREALRTATDERARAEAALALGPALLLADQIEESVAVLDQAAKELGPDAADLRVQLEVALLSSIHLDLAEHERWSGQLTDHTASDESMPPPLRRVALGHLAQRSALLGRPHTEVSRLALEALADGLMLEEQTSESPAYYFAASSLVLSEDFALSRDALTAAREDAERRGSPIGFAFASAFRALPNVRLGDLDAAEADSLDALAVSEEHGLTLPLVGAVIWLVEGLVTRGRYDEADALLERTGMNGELPLQTWFLHALEKRGRLRVAQGRFDEGIADLNECGQRSWTVGNRSIGDTWWRSSMVPALLRLGRPDEARELADEELRLARAFGGPHAIARSLLGVAATMPDGNDALALLTEARSRAADASTAVVEAEALIATGAMHRRSSQRAAARDALRAGLDLAARCGATRLVETAREELAASGARQRGGTLRAPGELTPSELRIARLAAEGHSNRDIARSIFVTEKTVETHLTSVYAKLRIGSRRELAEGLARR